MNDPVQSSPSQPLSDLAAALIQFQQAVPTIHDNDNSYHGSFANLPGILSTIGPALRSNGLAVSQLPEQINGTPGLRTTLMHVSGQMVSSVTPLTINAGKNGTQEWGKAMTYTRRYALQAVLGLCVGIEDNDADLEPTAPPVRGGKAEPAAAKASEDLTQKEKDLCIGMIATIAKPISDGGMGDKAAQKQLCESFRSQFRITASKVSDGIQKQKHKAWIEEQIKALEAEFVKKHANK